MAEDFTKMAKTEYDQLIKELENKKSEIEALKQKIAPLKSYLKTAGVLEVQKRKPRSAVTDQG